MSKHFDTSDEAYREAMRLVLMDSYFKGLPESHLVSQQFNEDLTEHQYRRADRFSTLLPWVSRVFNFKGARVIEVGSGTGSSTLAFASEAKEVHCFEIDSKSVYVANKRLEYWGLNNVFWHVDLFNQDARIASEKGQYDVVLLVAVLEHLHYFEFKQVVSLAHQMLRPGGIILIAETPNRLSVNDYHTSWIPFFQWLPNEVAFEYYKASPRAQFVGDLDSLLANNSPGSWVAQDRLQRWGRGVSYHDFELAISPDVHEMIVLDGWEDEILSLAPVTIDDDLLVQIFEKEKIAAHRAFARSWLYFVLKK